jgi:hypothetical protein
MMDVKSVAREKGAEWRELVCMIWCWLECTASSFHQDLKLKNSIILNFLPHYLYLSLERRPIPEVEAPATQATSPQIWINRSLCSSPLSIITARISSHPVITCCCTELATARFKKVFTDVFLEAVLAAPSQWTNHRWFAFGCLLANIVVMAKGAICQALIAISGLQRVDAHPFWQSRPGRQYRDFWRGCSGNIDDKDTDACAPLNGSLSIS